MLKVFLPVLHPMLNLRKRFFGSFTPLHHWITMKNDDEFEEKLAVLHPYIIESHWICLLRLYHCTRVDDFYELPKQATFIQFYKTFATNCQFPEQLCLIVSELYMIHTEQSLFIFIWTSVAAQKLHSGFRFEFRQGADWRGCPVDHTICPSPLR